MMTAHDIEKAVIVAGFAVYEADECADGVKMIVCKSETFTVTRQFYFGVNQQEVTAPVWFKYVEFPRSITADKIAEQLERCWREDRE